MVQTTSERLRPKRRSLVEASDLEGKVTHLTWEPHTQVCLGGIVLRVASLTKMVHSHAPPIPFLTYAPRAGWHV